MELIVKMKAEKVAIEDNVYRLEQINNYNMDLDAKIKELENSLGLAKTYLDKENKGVLALHSNVLVSLLLTLKTYFLRSDLAFKTRPKGLQNNWLAKLIKARA